MAQKVSDFIVDFLVRKGITDVFGYPGGMVTHLMESFSQKADQISAHINYHEQAAAFCACGYAQASKKTGVAYATSGPGATNLITGICNAYFDSVPTIFITGQVNTFERKGKMKVRQKGFQETDIVSMVRPITKYAVCVDRPENVRKELEKAYFYANSGRKGPVLLDIPMDIQRSVINEEEQEPFGKIEEKNADIAWEQIRQLCNNAKRPVIILGAGTKRQKADIRKWLMELSVPAVSSMPAFDVMGNLDNQYGFIGAYGNRTANFIVAKSDLIIALGTRLDVRQIGGKKENFAPEAKLIRVEVDAGELENRIKENELQVNTKIEEFMTEFQKRQIKFGCLTEWKTVCDTIREKLYDHDKRLPNDFIREISKKVSRDAVITTDVGQNQVWIAQSFLVEDSQQVLFSAGHGAMGYALPASIGAYYGSGRPVVCFSGDGGFQMNIQELQFIVRERLPITIMIINNHSLGMIRHFQEMYFESNYFQTVPEKGYTVPDFEKLSWAYGIEYKRIVSLKDIEHYIHYTDRPQIVEICLESTTYVFPKLEFGKPNQDQEPLLERELYNYLMEL